MKILRIAIPPTDTPRSCQNQDQGLRIFQKQNVQYQVSYPVWRQVLFILKEREVVWLSMHASTTPGGLKQN